MPTSNVSGTFSGTLFNITVTPCNLDPDLSVKDFVIFRGGSPFPNTSFTKVNVNTLQYSGANLTSATIEVRRLTDSNRFDLARFGTRVRSQDWNGELDKIVRRAEEYALNGIGPGSLVQTQLPVNDVYSTVWGTDTLNPPTRQAVFNKIETLAPLTSPALTGTPTVPTLTTGTSSTAIANAVFVAAELAIRDASISTINTTLTTKANLTSPIFLGTPSAPTAALGTNTGQLATTSFVQSVQQPYIDVVYGLSVTLTRGGTTKLPYNSIVENSPASFNVVTNSFTVPAGLGGRYRFCASAGAINVTFMDLELFVNGSFVRRFANYFGSEASQVVAGMVDIRLTVGDVVDIRTSVNNSSALPITTLNDTRFSYWTGSRIGV